MRIIFLWVLYPLTRPFYLVLLITNTLLLALLVILISPLDRHGNLVHYIGKFWSRLNILLSGTRLEVHGRDKIVPGQNYIVMANHQSLFDVWALIATIPLQLRWIVKIEIRKMPIFGYALERMQHIYIDRRHHKAALQSLEQAAAKVRAGTSVIIFPEGTRSRDGQLRKFHNGGALLAIKSGVPILPVTVNGSRFVLPSGTLALMPGKIQIKIDDPIDPRPFDEKHKGELCELVKQAIASNLDLNYGSFVRQH